jgi:hypothetical protein
LEEYRAAMKIDMLYFEGCPSWKNGLVNLQTALVQEDMQADINLILIKGDAEAMRLHFLGSPSFHVNGVDLWPEERDAYNLSCRIYSTPKGLKGEPTVEMLREKLATFKNQT